jgi:hypothetical protein
MRNFLAITGSPHAEEAAKAAVSKDARVNRSSFSMLADFLTASLADNPH